VPARAREEHGFGLIELLMAMTILNIGILAIVAAFNSGIVTLRRASLVSTGAVLADQQMELYRSLTYDQILLTSSTIPTGAPYTTDSAYSATQVTGTCGASTPANACNASRSISSGPDRHSYRVDSYIVISYPSGTSRQVKQVTVVVRDGRNVNSVLAREASTFDCSTGQGYNASGQSTVTCPTS
jgi:type II secretory pathway pseudopilin PulG